MGPTLVSAIKREFHVQLCFLGHDKPELFAKSQWHGRGSTCGVWTFLVYRWLLAVFLLAALVLSIVDIRTLGRPGGLVHRAKWPIYLTHWAFLMLTVQAVLAAVLATQYHFALGNPATAMTALHKSYWVLNNLSSVLAPGITFGYWATVYNPEIHSINFNNITVHVLNTVIVVVDLCIAGHPIRLAHTYQPIMLTVVYNCFTYLYFLAGGTNTENNPKIYPLLDWNKPLWALAAALGSATLLVVTHIFFWLLFLLRSEISFALLGNENKTEITSKNCEEETNT